MDPELAKLRPGLEGEATEAAAKQETLTALNSEQRELIINSAQVLSHLVRLQLRFDTDTILVGLPSADVA